MRRVYGVLALAGATTAAVAGVLLWYAPAGAGDPERVEPAPMRPSSEALRTAPREAAHSREASRFREEPGDRTSDCSAIVRVVWHDGTPARRFKIRVYDSSALTDETGKPLAAPFRRLGRRLETDERGIVSLDGLRPGPIGILVDRGADPFHQRELREGRHEIRIVIPRGVELTGRVSGPGGQAIANAEIWLSQPSNFTWGLVVARSGNDGSFRLRDVSVHQRVGARAAGFAPSLLYRVRGARRQHVELRLPGLGGDVTVRVVTRHGQAIAGAELVQTGHRMRKAKDHDGRYRFLSMPRLARTDRAGYAQLPGMSAGEVRFAVRAPGYLEGANELAVHPGQRSHATVQLERAAEVAGIVRDPEGVPVAGATVSVHRPGSVVPPGHRRGMPNPYYRAARSDARGHFRVDGIVPGDLQLKAAKPDRGQAIAAEHAKAGQHITWNPTLDPGRALRGRLVDGAGRPLARWTIRAYDRRGKRDSRTTSTDLEGRFRFVMLKADTYDLAARDTRRSSLVWARFRNRRPGPEEQVLRFPIEREGSAWFRAVVRPRLVHGEATLWVTQKDRPAALAGCGQARYGGRPDADGKIAVGPLPPGRYELSLVYGDRRTRLGEHRLQAHQEIDLGILPP